MWCKNINNINKSQKWWSFTLMAGVILAAFLMFVIILIYKKEREPGNSMEEARWPAHQEYNDIRTLFLDEIFPGGYTSLKIDFQNHTITYDPTVIFDEINYFGSFEGHFTEDEKDGLFLLLEEYKSLEWLDGRYYWDLNWNPKNSNASDYTLNPDANIARRTDFVSLNKTKDYLGMGEDEFWLRTERYWGELRYFNYNPDDFLHRKYTTFGVPDGYDELLDSLWDFALSKVDAVDWRNIMDQGSQEKMLEKFPYMGKETAGIPDSNKMWYFSINEFFGGKEHGPGVSLNFSRRDNFTPHQTEMIWYNTWYDADLNIVDTVGKVQKYREADEWFGNKWAEREIVMPFYGDDLSEEGKRKLAEILNKYQVATWQEPEYYQNQPEPSYIESGGFFNLSPNKQYEGISEQELEIRSTFETFIYLYDTDGKRLRLHYDNTGLPENYNEFREELWDFVMEYRMEQYDYLTIEKIEESDWRNHLDQWGREHLEIMQEKREDGRGTD